MNSKCIKALLILLCLAAGVLLLLSERWEVEYFQGFRKPVIENEQDQPNFHLSTIIGTRNDNYGGDPKERTARMLQQWVHYPWKYLNVEIIIVEWNYLPQGMKHLYEEESIRKVLSSQRRSKNVTVRFITVPHDIAQPPDIDCPMLELSAKNVGLKRSLGNWKLVTNQDNMYSASLLKFLDLHIGLEIMDPEGFYQKPITHRAEPLSTDISYDAFLPLGGETGCDIAGDIGSSIGDVGSCDVERFYTHVSGCGDFQLFHKSLQEEFKTAGYMELLQDLGVDSEFVFRVLYKYNKRGYVIKQCHMCHQYHTRERIQVPNVGNPCRQVVPFSALYPLFDEMMHITEPNQFQDNHPLWAVANPTETWGFPNEVFVSTDFPPEDFV